MTATNLTAFSYIRVSTPSQQVSEQVAGNRAWANGQGVKIIGQYGDYGKRHKAKKRQSFQQMLEDIVTHRPNFLLVQRLDRFGTADPNQLGYFLTILKQNNVRLITTMDGVDRSKTDLATSLQNVIAAAQSRQEQIDKAERVLFGKKGKAVLGQYVGSKYLAYGFDLLCIGKDGQEKWRLVEDGSDCRIKYVRGSDGKYGEAERYTNEIISDPNGVMEDRVVRFRPQKERGEMLMYSPSIREDRVQTLRRVCEWFADGWTTYRIAQQLNEEGNKPVHADHWYSALIDGLLDNPLLTGKPAWNRTSQASFRRIEGDRIIERGEEEQGFKIHDRTNWYVPEGKVFEPIIPDELFDRIQQRLQERREGKPMRSPRSEELWFGGLWVCGETQLKLAGDSRQRCFRVKHPDHQDKRLSFDQAEGFISQYLEQVGKRLDTFGEAAETKNLLSRLETQEWLTELRLDYIVIAIQDRLEAKMHAGLNRIGEWEVILDYDGEGNRTIDTDADLLELYCLLVKDDMENSKQTVTNLMDERTRLVNEFIGIKVKNQFIADAYTKQIDDISRQIQTLTAPPDFKAWWATVQEELELLRQQQEQVRRSLATGDYIQKAKAIRSIIDRIVIHWGQEPTTDKRHKSGYRTFVRGVEIVSQNPDQYPNMTIETSRA